MLLKGMEMHVRLEPYDNEEYWGVRCYVDGKLRYDEVDEAACLWRVLENEFDVEVEHEEYSF